jgi:hypothetical protein
MAKGKLKRQIEIEPEPDQDDTNGRDATAEDIALQSVEDKEAAAAMAIEEVMGAEEMQEGSCRVRRRGHNDTEFMHLERVPVSLMKPDLWDFIAKRYGGGRYELIFVLPPPRSTFYAKKRVDIDFRIGEGEFFKAAREPAAATPSAIDKLVDKVSGNGDGQNSMFLTFLKMTQDQNAAMIRMQSESSAQVIAAISNMAAALKGGDKPGFDMLQALAVFDKLKARDNSVDPIKLMEMAHNWFRENSGDDEEPQWVKLVQALAPMLLGKMPPGGPEVRQIEAQQQPGQPSQPGTVPQPAPQPQPEAQPAQSPVVAMPAAEPQPEGEEMNIRFLLKMIRPKLFAQIEAGASPQDAVDLVENPFVLTDGMYDQLETALKLDTWKADLFGDLTLTEKQDAWLTEFRRLFLEACITAA